MAAVVDEESVARWKHKIFTNLREVPIDMLNVKWGIKVFSL
jgi:hypothetical protein